MRATAIRRPVHLALAMAVMATGLMVVLPGTAPAGASTGSETETSTDSGSTETTTTLTHDSPQVSTSHDAGSGGWAFIIEGNKHVMSVRISVVENDCATGGETLWATKVTDEELKSGAVARKAAFAEGLYCSHLLLDGNKNATATVTSTVPVRREPEPDPSESPTSETSPSPEASPSESAMPDASASPTPSPEPTDTTSEYDRCSKDTKVRHRVLAGATGPDPDAPFIYQKFYPSRLQVHQGDLVEWCFNAGVDWHTVTFLPVDMDVALHPEAEQEDRPRIWRWDETGQKAFDESFLFGHEEGDEKRLEGDPKKKCGRGAYYHHEPLAPCEVDDTETKISSALWDEFFSIPKTGTFQARINLEPGLYRYHCNIHSSMEGFIEAVPQDQALANPSPLQIDAEIASDHAAAKELFEELSDPSNAYDFEERRWTVHVGAQTDDRSVAIEQFLPARIEVRRGDSVHYVAGSDEPNTVTFPGGRLLEGEPLTVTHPDGREFDLKSFSDPQGGFSAGGRCGPHSCPTGLGAPWGMTGLAFVWNCDADGRASGAPGTLPYIPPATANRTNGAMKDDGCVRGGLPEMITQPWYGDQQRAPGDLVVSEKTFHNSGTILDASLPDWYRTWPSNGVLPAGEFPSDFDAKFPTTGTFKYFCAAHEFMNGVVNVIERTR